MLPPHLLSLSPANGSRPFLSSPLLSAMWFVDFRAVCLQWATAVCLWLILLWCISESLMKWWVVSATLLPRAQPSLKLAMLPSMMKTRYSNFSLWRLLSVWKWKTCRMLQWLQARYLPLVPMLEAGVKSFMYLCMCFVCSLHSGWIKVGGHFLTVLKPELCLTLHVNSDCCF